MKYFSDQASEMVSGQQRARLARLFISLTIVSPSAKLSNGIAERANRTLLDIARSLLVGSGLPIVFWAEAFEMATNIYNRVSHSANPSGQCRAGDLRPGATGAQGAPPEPDHQQEAS